MLEDLTQFVPLLTLLIAVLLLGLGLGMSIEQIRTGMRRRAWRQKHHGYEVNNFPGGREKQRPFPLKVESNLKVTDAADQLRIVLEAKFSIKPLLNKSETRVFKELSQVVLNCNPAWQVMAQVSLGEILQCKDPRAHSCINSKRVDLLLVDENCMPRHVVEYHGTGHHRGSAAARDAVKKEALRRAGITYHEVLAGETTPSDLRRLIEKLIDRAPSRHLPRCWQNPHEETLPENEVHPQAGLAQTLAKDAADWRPSLRQGK